MNETFKNSFNNAAGGMLGIFAAFGIVVLTSLGMSKLAMKITERKLKKMTKDENPSEENKEED